MTHDEAKTIITKYSENKRPLKALMKRFKCSAPTIKNYMKNHMPGFKYNLIIRNPNDYEWLINKSVPDTAKWLKENYLNKGKSTREVSWILNAPDNQVRCFIYNHVGRKKGTNVSERQIGTEFDETDNLNRMFSVYAIGAKPEALDRLMEVA